MQGLIDRIRRMGLLFVVGLLVIVGVSLGIYYFQQGAGHDDLQGQIDQLSLNLLRPLPGTERLELEYDEANRAFPPMMLTDVLDIIIGIADESGIDTDLNSGKFSIPAVPPGGMSRQKKVGQGSYSVLSFNGITVQGDRDAVMTFISNLESGERLKTLVVTRVEVNEVAVVVEVEGEEGTEIIETVATLNVDLYTKSGGGLS